MHTHKRGRTQRPLFTCPTHLSLLARKQECRASRNRDECLGKDDSCEMSPSRQGRQMLAASSLPIHAKRTGCARASGRCAGGACWPFKEIARLVRDKTAAERCQRCTPFALATSGSLDYGACVHKLNVSNVSCLILVNIDSDNTTLASNPQGCHRVWNERRPPPTCKRQRWQLIFHLGDRSNIFKATLTRTIHDLRAGAAETSWQPREPLLRLSFTLGRRRHGTRAIAGIRRRTIDGTVSRLSGEC